jgi:hypothetical protein
MPSNKKHHYVPKFYLRGFTPNDASINLFNLKRNKLIKGASLKSQCYRDYFYGKEGQLESSLADFEGGCAELFRFIREEAFSLPSYMSSAHAVICSFVVIQASRTQAAADYMDEFTNSFWKTLLRDNKEVTQEMLDSVVIKHNAPAEASLYYNALTYPLIMDMEWALLLASPGNEFITSDNPVIKYNQLMSFKKYGSSTGYLCKGLQIFIPLTPYLTLFMWDKDVYTVNHRHNLIVIDNKADIAQINRMQVANATENIYFNDPTQADIIRMANSGNRFRRDKLTNLNIIPERNDKHGRSEVIMFGGEDIRTELTLSFVSLNKRAKKWLTNTRQQRFIPAVFYRNEDLAQRYKKFREMVKSGVAKEDEILNFLFDKH